MIDLSNLKNKNIDKKKKFEKYKIRTKKQENIIFSPKL